MLLDDAVFVLLEKLIPMPTTEKCRNCERIFDVTYEYCPYCGQEAVDNLTVGVLFSNTIENYFSIDARFFRSFATLMLRPGVLARRFVDGKRLKYLHPAQFYLFISVVFFFIFSFSVRDADTEVTQAMKEGFEQENNLNAVFVNADTLNINEAQKALKENQKIIGLSDKELVELDSVMRSNPELVDINFGFERVLLDSLITAGAPLEEKYKAMGMKSDASALSRRSYEQLLKFYEKKGGGMLQVLYDTIPIAMFLLLPVFALFLKIFYWKPATFAHHLVFSFYFFTFIFGSFCALILINKLWDIPTALEVLIYCSFIIYLMLALRNFYKSSWKGAFFKAFSISFLYMLIILPFAALGIILTAFLLY